MNFIRFTVAVHNGIALAFYNGLFITMKDVKGGIISEQLVCALRVDGLN